MDKVRVHAFVSGRVQGVFFRASTMDKAASVGGLTGWVCNLSDGRVEIVCEGDKDRVEQLVKWLHRGPSGALVSGVDVKMEKHTGEFSNFDMRF